MTVVTEAAGLVSFEHLYGIGCPEWANCPVQLAWQDREVFGDRTFDRSGAHREAGSVARPLPGFRPVRQDEIPQRRLDLQSPSLEDGVRRDVRSFLACEDGCR
jgi:hypothetical protein